MRDLDERLDGHGVRMDPRALHIGEEYLGRPGHAEARMDALLALVDQREIAALDVVDAVDGAGRGCNVARLDDRRAARRRRCGAAAAAGM